MALRPARPFRCGASRAESFPGSESATASIVSACVAARNSSTPFAMLGIQPQRLKRGDDAVASEHGAEPGNAGIGIVGFRVACDHHFKVGNRAGDPITEARIRTGNLPEIRAQSALAQIGPRTTRSNTQWILSRLPSGNRFQVALLRSLLAEAGLRSPGRIQSSEALVRRIQRRFSRTTRSRPRYARSPNTGRPVPAGAYPFVLEQCLSPRKYPRSRHRNRGEAELPVLPARDSQTRVSRNTNRAKGIWCAPSARSRDESRWPHRLIRRGWQGRQ